MTKYERYVQLRNSMNLKDADVSRGTKIAKSTFSDWKNGRSEPKNDKLQKISDYFGVKIDYFLDDNVDYDKFTDIPINNDVKEIALNIQHNTSLRLLYDTVKDASPEEIQTFIRIIKAFKETQRV
ncbi:MAG: helix-turn-helix transcriptional regulator [Clostridiales bacterium]|nr:helix-turn-helix transcriptional regulator [Clostridiales bacterium]